MWGCIRLNIDLAKHYLTLKTCQEHERGRGMPLFTFWRGSWTLFLLVILITFFGAFFFFTEEQEMMVFLMIFLSALPASIFLLFFGSSHYRWFEALITKGVELHVVGIWLSFVVGLFLFLYLEKEFQISKTLWPLVRETLFN